jgi:D-sedoheptulose 7-phosphate isomerase
MNHRSAEAPGRAHNVKDDSHRFRSGTFDIATFFDAEWDEHAEVLERSRAALALPFRALVLSCKSSLEQGGKLLFFGNGGSAADAQHLATELSVRYKKDRRPIAALALTTDSSTLTAAGNDLGFDEIFSRQIEALGRAGDVALGITTSGQSPNVLRALERAREAGLATAAFTGRKGGRLPGRVDHCLIVPSETTARIQEMHILVGQMLCGALEIELGLVKE